MGDVEKLLITGISGGQGRLLASRVADAYEVVGTDRVPGRATRRTSRSTSSTCSRRSSRTSFATSGPGRGSSRPDPPFPRRPRAAPRGERARHSALARVLRQVRGQAAGRRVELLRVRRASGEPVLPRRGCAAQLEPHLSRDARPGGDGYAHHCASLEVPEHGDGDPPAGEHARHARPLFDRHATSSSATCRRSSASTR